MKIVWVDTNVLHPKLILFLQKQFSSLMRIELLADVFELFQVHQTGLLSRFHAFAIDDLAIHLLESLPVEILLRYILVCLLVLG